MTFNPEALSKDNAFFLFFGNEKCADNIKRLCGAEQAREMIDLMDK